MAHPCTARRASWFAARVFLALVVCGTTPWTNARAEDPETARTLWEAGRTDEAYAALEAFLLTEPTAPDEILAASRLAAEMKDLDLLERVQGRAEIAGKAAEDPRLDLALGTAYLAIAEVRLASGAPGPTLSFLFADAEALAKRLVTTYPTYAVEGRLLWARTRRALGDLDGALAALEVEEALPQDSPILRLRGELRYDRAIEKGLDDTGRPTEEGRKDLETAIRLLQGFEDAPANLRIAWAAHRLGDLDLAREHYLLALVDDPGSPYPLSGLKSLFAARPDDLRKALALAAEKLPEDGRVLDALAEAQLAAKDARAAILTLDRRIRLDEEDPAGWYLGGRLFFTMRQWEEARKHLARALTLDPNLRPASRLMERTAQAVMQDAPDRAVEIYRQLTTLRPDDAIVWNNYGFLLRELASPYTSTDQNAVQTLRPDAPERARWYLTQAVAAYREAVRLVPEDLEGSTPNEVWIYAGIVNDYGVMRHYFTDVQDLHEAERLYLRALRLTDYGYKDAYHPNLRRLYGLELVDGALRWYRVAEEARYAQMKEVPLAQGGFDLVPDEAKRDLATRDARALRKRLYEEIREDAGADGDPWPPAGE